MLCSEIQRCLTSRSLLLLLLIGVSHMRLKVCNIFVCALRLLVFYLTCIYCEKLQRVPALCPSTRSIPLALRYLTRFLHTRCVFQVLKNVCLLCCATPRFVFIKRNIFSIAISSMCCTVLYTYINDICLYIFCCSWQRLLDFCCCLQSLNCS